MTMEYEDNPLRNPSRDVIDSEIGVELQEHSKGVKGPGHVKKKGPILPSRSNASNSTKSRTSSSPKLITKVNLIYTVVCFAGMLPPIINQILFIITQDTFYGEFWQYMLMPLTALCSILAHFCQPRNNTRSYLFFLQLFTTVLTFLNEVLGMIGSALVSEERFRRDLPSRVMTLLGW